MFYKIVNALFFIFHWIYKVINSINLVYRYIKFEDMENDNAYNIFALSDYSLIHIFKYVSSTDLYNLSLTCKRFEGLVKEKKLWHKIDTRNCLNNKEKVKFCIERINEHTTDLLICSDRRDIQVLPDDFFTSTACANLSILALENQLIRGDLAKLSEYPKTLVELSLRKSFVLGYSTFFKLSYWKMENLKVLILDECGWVETYMLVQMSKYPKLEVVSLFKCKKLSDNDIAYLSLAGCFGFKQLRILDIRFTGLGDQILKTFYKHPTLQELYFQSYISTYRLDKTKRSLEIARGSPQKPHAYFTEYDDIPDTSLRSMQELFGNHVYRTCRFQNLTNHSIVMFKFAVPNVDNDYEVQSVLYKSPYGECNCGYGDRPVQQYPTLIEKPKSVHKSNRDEILKLKDIIKEEKYKKSSPYLYILAPKLHMDPFKNKTDVVFYEEQASTSNKQIYWINMREPVNLYEMAMFEHTDIHTLQTDTTPRDITSCFDCDPSVILGAPGPKLERAGVEAFLSDSSENEEPNKEGNIDMADKLVSIEDSNVIVEELYDSFGESDGGNEQVKTIDIRNRDSSEDSAKSENSDIDKNDQKFENGDTINGTCNFGKESQGDNQSNIEKEESTSAKNHSNRSNSTVADESKKCKRCGVKIAGNLGNRNDQGVCKECKGKGKSRESKIIRLKFMRTKPENLYFDPSDSDEQDKTSQPEPNFPSTSRTEGTIASSSASNKRRCDNTSASTEPKKLKTSNDDTYDGVMNRHVDQDDLNISYEVDDLNAPNMVYINVNVVDEEPNLINLPMGRGLINILLGVDNETKTGIKKLSLRGFPRITDGALEYLTTLKLDLLDITKTGVTRCGVKNFIRQNPTCRVLHESACVCQPDMHF